MGKQLTRICIVCGIFYYLSCFIYLQHIGMPPITIVFTWVVPLFLGLLPNSFAIKTNLFSDIKDGFTSPVYKLEKDCWGDNVVSKYIVEYSHFCDDLAVFFPYIWLVRFRQYSPEDSVYVNKAVYNNILYGEISVKDLYLKEMLKAEAESYKEMSAKKTEKEKLREVNKEYYDNFKTK